MKSSSKSREAISSFASKRATLSGAPASVSRHKRPGVTPASGKAMRGGKFKK